LDPDRIRIGSGSGQKFWIRIRNTGKKFYFFDQKLQFTYLYFTSKHEISEVLFCFSGSFFLFRIRIRIPNVDPYLDPDRPKSVRILIRNTKLRRCHSLVGTRKGFPLQDMSVSTAADFEPTPEVELTPEPEPTFPYKTRRRPLKGTVS
jgi:hypothetical protein